MSMRPANGTQGPHTDRETAPAPNNPHQSLGFSAAESIPRPLTPTLQMWRPQMPLFLRRRNHLTSRPFRGGLLDHWTEYGKPAPTRMSVLKEGVRSWDGRVRIQIPVWGPVLVRLDRAEMAEGREVRPVDGLGGLESGSGIIQGVDVRGGEPGIFCTCGITWG